MKPELSIVIPTLGFVSIDNTISSILKNKGIHKIEIIIIGKLHPSIKANYKKFIRHYPVKFKKGDLSKKRNLGFKKAKANIVTFIDDDVIIPKGWISRGLKHFKNKNIGDKDAYTTHRRSGFYRFSFVRFLNQKRPQHNMYGQFNHWKKREYRAFIRQARF